MFPSQFLHWRKQKALHWRKRKAFFIASCFPFGLALNKGLTPTSNPPEPSQGYLMACGPWKKWIVAEITQPHWFLGAGVSSWRLWFLLALSAPERHKPGWAELLLPSLGTAGLQKGWAEGCCHHLPAWVTSFHQNSLSPSPGGWEHSLIC